MHVKLLLEWEKDALVREVQEELRGTAAPDQETQSRTAESSHEDRSAGSQR